MTMLTIIYKDGRIERTKDIVYVNHDTRYNEIQIYTKGMSFHAITQQLDDVFSITISNEED